MIRSQNERILTFLGNGGSITPLDALREFNCFRLSARIYDLRKDGHNINIEYVKNKTKRFAKYTLNTSREKR